MTAFGLFVVDDLGGARKNPAPGAATTVSSSDSLPVEDPNAESIPLDRPEELQSAPDIVAPSE